MQQGICRLCGHAKDLTFEHVPPRVAFNKNTKYRVVSFDEYVKDNDPLNSTVKGKIVQGGTGFYSLCEDCNNFLGRTYVNPYSDWVMAAAEAISFGNSQPIAYTVKDLEPLKILKQIISMFLSLNGSWHSLEYSELANFVKEPRNNELSDRFKIYSFLNSEGQMRFSPFKGIGKLDSPGKIVLCSEMVFSPLGYVLTIDSDCPSEKLADITAFKKYEFDVKTELLISMFKLPTYLPLIPLDYRTKEEISQAIERDKKLVEQIKKMKEAR